MAKQQSWPDGAAAAEWRAHWPLVMASMAGFMMIGVVSYTLGPLMDPLKMSFGWTKSEITAGLTVYAIVCVFGQPLVGRMIDRWGPRRIGLSTIGASMTVIGMGMIRHLLNDWRSAPAAHHTTAAAE